MSRGCDKPVTAAEIQLAGEIMVRYEHQKPPMETSTGAMHDGSKRLRETEEWDAISYAGSAEEAMDRLVDSSTSGTQDPIVSLPGD